MGLKENLLLYTIIGVLIYIFSTFNTSEALILLKYITISVSIGKTCEIISYNVSVKYKFSSRGILLINFIVLSVVITVLYKINFISNIKFTIGISLVITLIMDFYHHRKYILYNEKLESTKRQLQQNNSYSEGDD